MTQTTQNRNFSAAMWKLDARSQAATQRYGAQLMTDNIARLLKQNTPGATKLAAELGARMLPAVDSLNWSWMK